MPEESQLFECAYCGALVRSRIVPEKCKDCGHAAFLICDTNIIKENKEEKNKCG